MPSLRLTLCSGRLRWSFTARDRPNPCRGMGQTFPSFLFREGDSSKCRSRNCSACERARFIIGPPAGWRPPRSLLLDEPQPSSIFTTLEVLEESLLWTFRARWCGQSRPLCFWTACLTTGGSVWGAMAKAESFAVIPMGRPSNIRPLKRRRFARLDRPSPDVPVKNCRISNTRVRRYGWLRNPSTQKLNWRH